VEVYDPEKRAVTVQYNLGTGAPVKIVLVGAKPLALSSGKAFWGDEIIDLNAGNVEGLSSDGSRIWTVRKSGETHYLKSYELQNPTDGQSQCFFRTPAAPGVGQIFDARKLIDGVIALSTNKGIWFYNPSVRSWVGSPNGDTSQKVRLYLTSKYLIMVGEGNGLRGWGRLPVFRWRFNGSRITTLSRR
jgi:hypothetical protein